MSDTPTPPPVPTESQPEPQETSSANTQPPTPPTTSKVEEILRKVQKALPDKLFPDTIQMDGEKAWKVAIGVLIANEIIRCLSTSKFMILLLAITAIAGIYAGLLAIKRLPEKVPTWVPWALWVVVAFCAINLFAVPSLWDAVNAVNAAMGTYRSMSF